MQKPAHTVYTLNLETRFTTTEETQRAKTAERPKGTKTDSDEIATQAAIWFKLDD